MRDGRATYRLWRVRARVAFLSSRAPVARTDANAHYSRRRALSARLPEVLELPERLRVGCGGACHRIVSEDELRAVAPVVPQYRGGFVSSCGWLRHRPGGVGLRSERAGVTGPWGRRRGTRGPARSREQPWGQKSVHRSAKTASRCRSGALVYTVATRGSRELRRELRREPRQVARAPQPPWRAGGVPSVAASRLVGKTDPAPVAPPLAWRLCQDVNPHKPPKGFFQCKRTIGGDGHAGYR